jgi:uncharacterized protein YcnI
MGLLNRLLLVTALAHCGCAFAHVVVDPKSGEAGSYFRAAFRVGHGCDAAPTVAITVKFPEDMKIVRPAPKPGWALEMRKSPTVEVTWRGKLEAEYYDEFIVQLRLPDTAGKRTLAIRQECEGKGADWTAPLEVLPVKK